MDDFNPDAFLAAQTAGAEAPVSVDGFDPDVFLEEALQEKHGTPIEQGKAFLEGAAKGVAGPLATLAETKIFGVPEENIRGREEANPWTAGAGEAIGLGAGLLTGTGEAAVMTKAGEAAVGLSGLAKAGESATFMHKVGSEAVKQAVEMAVLQSGDEASKMILHDPNQSAETAIANVGLASALGGGVGAVFGGTGALWSATVGPKVEGFLGALKSRMNGESASVIAKEAEELGINIKPEYVAAMGDDPFVRGQASTLRQTDTAIKGRSFQQGEQELRTEIAHKMAESLGKTPEELGALEVSHAAHGKDVGDTLVKEYKAKIDPIIKDLEETKEKFGSTVLAKDSTSSTMDYSNPYKPVAKEVVTPGVATELGDKIMTKAAEEGWLADPLSPEARMIKSVVKDLRNKETLQDLIKLGQNIGKNTKSTLPFGMETPLSRAGSIVRSLVRDSENSTLLGALGAKNPELVAVYRGALDDFKTVAKLRDELNSRLKVGGSVSGFAKGLSNMAKTDAETLLNRLKGTNDAHVLSFLTEFFPETAQKVRQFHLDALLEKAVQSTEGGKPALNAAKLMKGLDNMSPEMRQFVVGEETVSRIQRMNGLLERLKDASHNHSNTARTVDKIMSGGGAGAMGVLAALSGHGGLGLMVPVAQMLGKEGTAGARLGILKFMGSAAPVKAEGFKSAVSFLNAAAKGESFLNKAAANVFKPGLSAIPGFKAPTEAARIRLDRLVSDRQQYPQEHLDAMNKQQVGHYMPEHQAALAKSTTTALQYLQQLKPMPYRASPLDKEVEPSPTQKARYNRALDIANQPLIVFDHIKNGTVQQSDIQDIKSMYPALYQGMVNKLSSSLTLAASDEKQIPYKTRMGLSLFMGQAMDSSMLPSSIQAAQASKTQVGGMQQQGQQASKGSPSKLGSKMPKMYQTASQNAEIDRSGR